MIREAGTTNDKGQTRAKGESLFFLSALDLVRGGTGDE
jgi:hypothetical protein